MSLSTHARAHARARDKMERAGKPATAVRHFSTAFEALAHSESAFVPESEIAPLSAVPTLTGMQITDAEAQDAIAKTAILKLNGGLATSIGAPRAKVLLKVANGQSFLDAITKQIRYARKTLGAHLPLIFMNSRSTHAATKSAVPSDMAVAGIDMFVIQNVAPKLRVDSLEPVEWLANPDLEWAPSGHGDFFVTVYESGILSQLISAGYRYLAVSNLDNLGATPSAHLAGWFAKSGAPMMMEVSRRTEEDVKGGHIALRRADGRIILRERAQTSQADEEYFTDSQYHRYFNTNNLWFDLHALRDRLVECGGVLGLAPILNRRHVDPSDPSSPEVYQVESAIGSAIEHFAGAQVIEVPRERFVPVKTRADLAAFRRDLGLDAHGRIYRFDDEHAPRSLAHLHAVSGTRTA